MKVFADETLTVGWQIGKMSPPQTSLTVMAKAILKLEPGVSSLLPIEDLTLSGDVPYDDDPAKGNIYSSDFANFKPRADVLLVGSAHAPGGDTAARFRVRFRVGPMSKSLNVIGPRRWKSRLLGSFTDPQPIASLPIRYDRAAGGPNDKYNPIGAAGEELPNFELPAQKNGGPRDAAAPAGFGPIPAAWMPRSGFIGTYNGNYLKTRWPWLPVNFDYSYFNAAPRDQQVDGYLRGDEMIELENLHPKIADYRTRLPGMRARWFLNEQTNGEFRLREVPLVLDTLWIDMDNERIVLVWRGVTDVRSMKLTEIEQMLVVTESIAEAPKGVEFYKDELANRGKADEFGPDDDDAEIAKAEEELKQLKADAAANPPAPTEEAAPVMPGEGSVDAVQFTRTAVELFIAEKASLAGANLGDLDLSGLDFSTMDLTEVNLANAKLEGANLAGANLTDATLFAAKLSGANLAGAILDGGVLDEAKLDGAQFAGASFNGAVLTKLNLAGVDLSGCQAVEADFSGSNLAGAVFTSAKLEKADFSQCVLTGADFSKAALKAASFDAVKAKGVKMTEADITGFQGGDGSDFSDGQFQRVKGPKAVFEECILDRAVFSEAVLTGAQFSSASMRDAKFDQIDFTKTDFSDAVLHNSVFTRCNLLRTSFDRADLTKADVRDCNAYEAGFWEAITKDANWRGTNLTNTLLA